MTRISGPRPVKFRAFVDHIDNVEGDVCALRFGTRYVTAKVIEFHDVPSLRFGPRRTRQPRVSVDGVGTIWRSADKERIVVT